mgnify:CR=1 FL=1
MYCTQYINVACEYSKTRVIPVTQCKLGIRYDTSASQQEYCCKPCRLKSSFQRKNFIFNIRHGAYFTKIPADSSFSLFSASNNHRGRYKAPYFVRTNYKGQIHSHIAKTVNDGYSFISKILFLRFDKAIIEIIIILTDIVVYRMG